MIFFTTLLLIGALVFLLLQRTTTLLTYFQQEEYDGTRFVASSRDVRLFDIRATVAVVLVTIAGFAGLPKALCLSVLAAAFVIIGYMERQYRYKKPLAKTQRATRIWRLALVPLCVGALLVALHGVFAIVVLQLVPFALIGANRILQPFQERINARYMDQARTKLAALDPVRIGITGSFGKTTVKHMFAEILETSGPVFYSPGSINTVLGHTRHIRQRLQHAHKYFIAEMGAYGIGSIKRLCDFIQPTYGIVTAVGDAHTERFGSIEQAKSELAAEVCAAGGTMVLNVDVMQYAPFQKLKDIYGTQIITVGAQDADVTIEATEIDGGSWSITLHSRDDRVPTITFELPLIGDHNVMNAALAVTLALLIDITTADQIPFFTKTIAQIPHRLQKIETPGSALILDDAYNSNELGFMSAVCALDKLATHRGGRRILVTPGIAELGLEHDRVHARLGTYSGTRCDVIYVVNPSRIESFASAAKLETAQVIEVPTFYAARDAIAKSLSKDDVVLYENDLPDLLEEKRFL